MRKWESRYADPGYRRTLTKCLNNHQFADNVALADEYFHRDCVVLRSTQDEFSGHPVIKGRTVLLETSDVVCRSSVDQIRQFARQHKLGVINYGWCAGGFALTFRTETMACKFRLLFNGTTRVAA